VLQSRKTKSGEKMPDSIVERNIWIASTFPGYKRLRHCDSVLCDKSKPLFAFKKLSYFLDLELDFSTKFLSLQIVTEFHPSAKPN
jgi:hypothetical protein